MRPRSSRPPTGIGTAEPPENELPLQHEEEDEGLQPAAPADGGLATATTSGAARPGTGPVLAAMNSQPDLGGADANRVATTLPATAPHAAPAPRHASPTSSDDAARFASVYQKTTDGDPYGEDDPHVDARAELRSGHGSGGRSANDVAHFAEVDPRSDSGADHRRRGGPGVVPRAEEDFDASSITGQFFRMDSDMAPHEEEPEETAPRRAPLSPSALARRARLRQVVTGVVSFATVITIAVVGKTLAAPRRPSAAVVVPSVSAGPESAKPVELKAAVAVAKVVTPPATPEVLPAPSVAASTTPSAAPSAPAAPSAAASASAEAGDEKKPAPSGGDAVALKKEAESLLNRGRRKEAIEKAREAIAADPSDAYPYLLLGSALQDSGKWKDGLEAYCECVRTATKGPVNECRAVGGHK